MKKMGYILIAVGIIILIIGVIMVAKPNQATAISPTTTQIFQEAPTSQSSEHIPGSTPTATYSEDKSTSDNKLSESDNIDVKNTAEVKNDPKEIGNAFENFIANLFTDKSTFTVLEWNQGTTSTRGVYAENDKNPDFRIKQTFRKSGLEYWVECKYRTLHDDGMILIKKYQLDRYRGIQRSSRIKIFMAIGVGQDPGNPDTIYIVPLDSIKDENIRLDDISRFKVAKNGAAFSNYIQNYFCKHVFRKIPM